MSDDKIGEAGKEVTTPANTPTTTDLNPALIQAIAGVVSQQIKENTQQTKPAGDPFEEVRNKGIEEEKQKVYYDKISSEYASVLTDFKLIMKDKADSYINQINGLGTEDKINTLAKEIIRKAKGDTESTKALIDSFKGQDVFNEQHAFNVHYKSALNELKNVSSPFFVPNSTTSYTKDDLVAISNKLFSSKSRNDAIKTAQNLKLLGQI